MKIKNLAGILRDIRSEHYRLFDNLAPFEKKCINCDKMLEEHFGIPFGSECQISFSRKVHKNENSHAYFCYNPGYKLITINL